MNKTGKDTAGAGVAKVRAATGNDNIGFLIWSAARGRQGCSWHPERRSITLCAALAHLAVLWL